MKQTMQLINEIRHETDYAINNEARHEIRYGVNYGHAKSRLGKSERRHELIK